MKLQKAHCPPNVVSGNPCLEYIIFPWFSEFRVSRSQNDDKDHSFKALSADYASGEPVRDHFENDQDAKNIPDKHGTSYSKVTKSPDDGCKLQNMDKKPCST
ncbi:hypothetical protein OROHE_026503 [Orobanche hederae]